MPILPNYPTMNEYITHGVNGILYDPENPEPIMFSNLDKISENAKNGVIQGYKKWEIYEKEIINYIEKVNYSS